MNIFGNFQIYSIVNMIKGGFYFDRTVFYVAFS